MPASALQLTAISVSSSGAFSTRFSLQVFRKIISKPIHVYEAVTKSWLSTQHPSPSKWNCGKWGQDLALWYCEDMWRQKNRSDLLWFHHVPSRPLWTSDLPVTWAVQQKTRLMVGEHFMSLGLLSTIKYLLLKYHCILISTLLLSDPLKKTPTKVARPDPRPDPRPRCQDTASSVVGQELHFHEEGLLRQALGTDDVDPAMKASIDLSLFMTHDSPKTWLYTWLYMTNCIFYSMCQKKRTWSYMFHACWFSN